MTTVATRCRVCHREIRLHGLGACATCYLNRKTDFESALIRDFKQYDGKPHTTAPAFHCSGRIWFERVYERDTPQLSGVFRCDTCRMAGLIPLPPAATIPAHESEQAATPAD